MLFVSAVKDLHRILGLNWKCNDVWFSLFFSRFFPRQKMKFLMLQIIAWPTCSSKFKRTSFPLFFSYKQLKCFIIDSFNLVVCTFLINSLLAPRSRRIYLYIFTKSLSKNTGDFSIDDKTSSIIPTISDNAKHEN